MMVGGLRVLEAKAVIAKSLKKGVSTSWSDIDRDQIIRPEES